MLQSPLFKSFFLTLCIVGGLEVLAIIFHLFATISWFDMLMHFSGGFLMGMFSSWILTWGNRSVSYGTLLLYGVLNAVIIGFFWELFELSAHLTDISSADYIADNGMDMIMDTLGGLVAVWYSYYRIK